MIKEFIFKLIFVLVLENQADANTNTHTYFAWHCLLQALLKNTFTVKYNIK